jgi:hypothetical protein
MFMSAFMDNRFNTPGHLRVQVRETRMAIFDSRIGDKRVMQIQFGKRAPSVLVMTDIVAEHPSLESICASVRHDKHAGMREFRLGSDAQAFDFGRELGGVLLT